MVVYSNIADIFDDAEQIVVYSDGNIKNFYPETDSYQHILDEWNRLLEGVHLMPAYGVSLNDETQREKEKGIWIEFIFAQSCEYGDMPFEKLLIQVDARFSGVNLIRYNSDCGYEGRCYYLDFTSDMSQLCRYLQSTMCDTI